MSEFDDILGQEPAGDEPQPVKGRAKGKAKKADGGPVPEAAEVPAPLAEALHETDTVLQAHVTRQANHEADLAPSIAKKAREDAEREEQLRAHDEIDARWRAHQAEQKRLQEEREAREGAAERIAILAGEIAMHEAAIKTKAAEVARLKALAEG